MSLQFRYFGYHAEYQADIYGLVVIVSFRCLFVGDETELPLRFIPPFSVVYVATIDYL